MATNKTSAQLRRELNSMLTQAKQLSDALNDQEARERQAAPPEPEHSLFRISVQFNPGGVKYEYLVVRSGRRYYTTGSQANQKVFQNWQAFTTWLRTETYWHSGMEPLEVAPGKLNALAVEEMHR